MSKHDNQAEMTQFNLRKTCEIFFEQLTIHEEYLGQRFHLDIYIPELKIAVEYDGPDHYDKVANHERDLRKNNICKTRGIRLIRWPYYFQLTRDVAKHIFTDSYSESKYLKSIKYVYGANEGHEILAPGLHRSKFTPANFTEPGMERFFQELDAAPVSLKAQVVKSLKLYQAYITRKYGNGYDWLLYPENNPKFKELLNFDFSKYDTNYLYPNVGR